MCVFIHCFGRHVIPCGACFAAVFPPGVPDWEADAALFDLSGAKRFPAEQSAK